MLQFVQLTKRDCRIYIRDKGAVFFSLLSMLIVLMLMGIFLGSMNIESVTELLNEYGGTRDLAADKENATHLVQYWVLAGILTINAVTVTLAVMTTMVKDAAEKRLESFYCAPVSKFTVACAYIAASVLLGMLLCIIPFVLALAYIVADGGAMLTGATIIRLFFYMLLNVFVFSMVMYLLAVLVKSVSAWSGLGTIIGTLVGFAGAVYIPMEALPEKVGTVLKYIPVLHGTSLMRKLCCKDIVAKTFAGLPAELVEEYNEAMGITIVMGDKAVSSGFQICFLLVCGMLALGIVMLLAGKRSRQAEG